MSSPIRDRPVSPSPALRSPQFASGTFAVLAVLALPFILYYGRNQWFFLDEWSFLTARPLPSLDGLLEGHNGHWVTTPLVVFRSVFAVFGIRTYFPYQVLVVLSHLVVVVLARLVMRRAGVSPWWATLVAAFLLLLGSGEQNIVFAFQISLNGSLICGLGALLLAVHDGPFDRRDVAALGLSIVGLTTSAVIVPLVAAIGTAVLLHRGPRPALVHVAIPGAIFLLWYALFRGETVTTADSDLGGALRFFAEMNAAVFEGLGQNFVAAVVIAAVAVGGLGVAWSSRRAPESGTVDALPLVIAMLVAWVGFAAITAVSRNGLLDLFPSAARATRYVHIGAVLLSPLVALGTQWLWSLRRASALVPVTALLVGLPGNVDGLVNPNPLTLGRPDFVAALATSPFLEDAPDSLSISEDSGFREFGPMTAGWIRRAVDNDDIDVDETVTIERRVRLAADLRLAMGPNIGFPTRRCEPSAAELSTTVDAGDSIVVDGTVEVVATDGEADSPPRVFGDLSDDTIEVFAGPIDVRISAVGDSSSFCLARE